ncbi:MAG: polyprenyl synthetase family protein [Planctomycetota bacterium]|nr:polyprenyl synthetase family protein [Planctomycetota bacterium]
MVRMQANSAVMAALRGQVDALPAGGARDAAAAALDCGKHLRAHLACACGHQAPAALDMACAVELLHAASLVVDDLPGFDNAAQRRGAPSVHAQFGASAGILTAHLLTSMAYRAAARVSGAVAELAQAEQDMCLSQWRETLEGSAGETEKTAPLFAAAAAMGALAGGCEPSPWRALGAELGTLYQHLDDWRDGDCRSAAQMERIQRGQAAAMQQTQALVGTQAEHPLHAYLDGFIALVASDTALKAE